MPQYLVIECPLCEARRPFAPGDDVSTDAFVRAMATHLLEAHPSVEPSRAERLLERALEDPKTYDADEPLASARTWTTEPLDLDEHDGDGPDESADDPDRSPFDDWIGRS